MYSGETYEEAYQGSRSSEDQGGYIEFFHRVKNGDRVESPDLGIFLEY